MLRETPDALACMHEVHTVGNMPLADTIGGWDQMDVLYGEVSLIQRYICTQLYVRSCAGRRVLHSGCASHWIGSTVTVFSCYISVLSVLRT